MRSLFAVAVLALVVLGGSALAQGQCESAPPQSCPNCFAVFVMPDTQHYTIYAANQIGQGQGQSHFNLMTSWICRHRSSWREPSTGKTMPIAMTIHLGDIVDNDHPSQWTRADNAFDKLDACTEGEVPYLVIPGNHDLTNGHYEKRSTGFFQHFNADPAFSSLGPDRWDAYRCADPSQCEGGVGDWFVGGGDPIRKNSRNLDLAGGPAGPPEDVPGRHRAGLIRAPNGQRFLFLGLEYEFDHPPEEFPSSKPPHGNDLQWPQKVLADYPGVPTILFHHMILNPLSGQFTEAAMGAYHGDSKLSTLWDAIVEPTPQVLMTFNGHWTGANRQLDAAITRASGGDVIGVYRDYQGTQATYGGSAYGGGWNDIAVFDPDSQQIRIRSYRIGDVALDGRIVDDEITGCDYPGGTGPRVFPYAFPDTRPASLDNCPGRPNPDQRDSDANGVGDACDSAASLSCGLGTEAALILPVLWWLRRRRR
jgi:hypothetical protein